MINKLKNDRAEIEKEFNNQLFSSRTIEEFLSTMLEQDYNRVYSTLNILLEYIGLDSSIADGLLNEMETLSNLIEQCYIANIVVDLEKLGYIYKDKCFTNGKITIPYKDIVLKDIKEVISMFEQLEEIRGLDERDPK